MTVWPFEPLQMFGYNVVEADPAWDFVNYSDKGTKKGADPHYEVMSLADIMALPVGQLARPPAILLLWVPTPMIPQGLRVMAHWGFEYKSKLEWRKIYPSGKVRTGPGYRVRTKSEPILLGALGPQTHAAFPSIFDGMCFDGIAREHSRKPDEFYDIVREATPGHTRCSLFTRETRDGFESWGREARKFDDPGREHERRRVSRVPEPMTLFEEEHRP